MLRSEGFVGIVRTFGFHSSENLGVKYRGANIKGLAGRRLDKKEGSGGQKSGLNMSLILKITQNQEFSICCKVKIAQVTLSYKGSAG